MFSRMKFWVLTFYHVFDPGQIIHNPGTIPDARFLASCNMTVVFEGTYATYQQHDFGKSIKSFLAAPGNGRNNLAMIIHSLPSTLSEKDKKSVVKDIKKLAAGIFVTDLAVDYYASFAQGWGEFVRDVNA